MQAFIPDSLPLDKLDNPGWDPICFASNEAFAYFAPGLVKLVLDHAVDYIQQFIFYAQQPERLAAFTPGQARSLVQVLDFLVLPEAKALENNLVVDELNSTRDKLEQRVERDAVNHAP
jgi:hypothetical protein